MIALFVGTVWAAEVVWISEPTTADRVRVAEAAGAKQGPLSPEQFIAAATAIGPRDDQQYTQLDKTLERVRGLEDRLDGEVIIMHDLTAAVDGLDIVRNDRDRDRVFAALAYAGFAVDRYYADDLSAEEGAAPYRRVFASKAFVAPWVDAAALAPEREVTAYEIAQAPQRIAFRKVQTAVGALARGSLDVRAVPDGVVLYLDGGQALVGSDRTIRVVPGHHWLHAVRQDAVAARWVVDIEPGSSETLSWPETEGAWHTLVAGLGTLLATPAALQPSLDAVGGEIWIARPGKKAPDVWRVTATSVQFVDLATPAEAGEADAVTLSFGGGWMYTDDFYTLNADDAEASVSTVNAAAVALGVVWQHALGWFRFGGGADVLFTPGEFHVAQYGDDRSMSLRPHVFVTAGHERIGVTAGLLFPYHAAIGARGSLPLTKALSLTGRGLVGFAPERERNGADPFQAAPVTSAWLTADWSIRP
jgi:hypothetical protein